MHHKKVGPAWCMEVKKKCWETDTDKFPSPYFLLDYVLHTAEIRAYFGNNKIHDPHIRN